MVHISTSKQSQYTFMKSIQIANISVTKVTISSVHSMLAKYIKVNRNKQQSPKTQKNKQTNKQKNQKKNQKKLKKKTLKNT